MQLLITNDDGIDAPGLAALEEAAAGFGEYVVLAPVDHHSGCSHRVTTDRALSLTALGGRRHQLDGTPTDCTRVGLSHFCPHAQWVLSGINDGGNLGADVYHSGTVAAVREAALLGKPGIALSQYRRRGVQADWQRAARWAQHVLELLLPLPLAAGSFWNVNFPCCNADAGMPEVVFCALDPNPLPVEYRLQDGRLHYQGNYHERLRRSGADVDVCFSGRIAITELRLS
jgi:5'-nucleotidase